MRGKPLFDVVIAFAIGLILSPLSLGFVYYVIGIFALRLYFIWRNGMFVDTDTLMVEASCLCSSLFGFIIGRLLLNDKKLFRPSYIEKKKKSRKLL